MSTRPLLMLFMLAITIYTLIFDVDIVQPLHIKIEPLSQPTKKIILIPLDSRPPCTDFVIDAARIANVEVITPSSKDLDYFTIPGETIKTRQWLLNNCKETDAIIISIDQLLYGGLIAARESSLTDRDIDSLADYLITLHRMIPNTPIYAFSILPRMQPQQSIDNYQQRRALMAYSRLLGLAHAGLPADDESIFEALSEISYDNLNIYLGHFNECEKLNHRLIELSRDGILDRLVIGLDDGEKHSIQNLLIDNLQQFIANTQSVDKISLIHGADEIALTLIAELVNSNDIKVCVKYNDCSVSSKVLPFMAVPIETVVNEKLNQLQLTRVDDPAEADFTLFVSVNGADDSNADFIAELIEAGYKVAMVDLGEHFDEDETLLPILINRGVAINSLIAYASWNTASNSIGTAISQAVIAINGSNTLENLRFLNQRFIEDQFYLKDVIDTVNYALKKNGSYDTSYLDYGTEYEFATFVMRTTMAKRIADYKCSNAFKAPVVIDGGHKIRLKDFDFEMKYPWPRTFEIRLKINELVYIEVK